MVENLELAVRNGDFKSVQKLLKEDFAQELTSSRMSLLELLFTKNDNEVDRLRIAEYLIEHKIDVNHQDEEKCTALHILLGASGANWQANPEYIFQGVKLLIQAGANVNIRDIHGGTPLSYAIAVLKGTTEELLPVYEALLKAGAYVDERSGTPSCLDLTKKFPWRSSLLALLERYND